MKCCDKIKNCNFCSKSKLFYIISSAIIAAAIFISIFFGVNLGIDYKGGNIITVVAGETVESDYSSELNKITTVLDNYNLSVYSDTSSGFGIESAIIVRYMDVNGDMAVINANVKADIEELYADLYASDNTTVIVTTLSPSHNFNNDLVNAGIVLISTLAIIFIYVSIRTNVKSALASVITVLHDVLLIASMVVLLRIEIGKELVSLVIGIIMISTFLNMLITTKIAMVKKELNTEKKHEPLEIINIAIRNMVIPVLTFSIISILFALALIVGGLIPAIIGIGLPLIIGFIVITYSTLCFSPAIWLLLANKGKKI